MESLFIILTIALGRVVCPTASGAAGSQQCRAHTVGTTSALPGTKWVLQDLFSLSFWTPVRVVLQTKGNGGVSQSAMEIVNVLERSYPHKAFSSAVGHWCKQNSGSCCRSLAVPDNHVVPQGKGVGCFGSGVVWGVICVYKNKTRTASKYKTSTLVTRVIFSSAALC